MRVADPRQRLAEQRRGLLRGDGAAARHHCMESLAIHEFHHHIGDLVLHQKGVQGRQVGVVQLRLCARFSAKTLQQHGIPGEFGAEGLDCHHAVKVHVDGLVNYAHAAGANLFDDPVIPDLFSHHLLIG